MIAPDDMHILRKNNTNAELGYTRNPDFGRYEIFVRTPDSPRRSLGCTNDKCSVSALQPGTTYTVWLGACTGSIPVRCVGRPKPVVLTTTPNAKNVTLDLAYTRIAKHLCFFLICSEDPVAVTAANESTTSFIVEITPPEGNHAIVFCEVETKCGHGCSIPAGGQNIHCLLTGLEPATSYIMRARACL